METMGGHDRRAREERSFSEARERLNRVQTHGEYLLRTAKVLPHFQLGTILKLWWKEGTPDDASARRQTARPQKVFMSKKTADHTGANCTERVDRLVQAMNLFDTTSVFALSIAT